MIAWSTNPHYIDNNEELQAFQQLPLAHRPSVIQVTASAIASDEVGSLCFPNLKGLYVKGEFKIGTEDIGALFETILTSILQLLCIDLSNLHVDVVKYHRVLLRSPVSTTLRLLHISGPRLEEKEVDLMGKALQYNPVVEELSLWKTGVVVYRRYSALLLNIAVSRIHTLYNIPVDKFSLFCMSIILSNSKIASLYIRGSALESKRWRKYLIGSCAKLQRTVSFQNRNYVNLFSLAESKFIESL